ncbi:AvrD family protein [Cellulomonas sp. NPDC055163]
MTTTPVHALDDPDRTATCAAPDRWIGAVDAYLGPRETRFFGSGYRTVEAALHAVRVVHVRRDGTSGEPGATGLTARGVVDPGERWSTKGDHDLAPHLSTPDVLRLTEAVALRLLATHLAAGPPPGAWLDEVRVSAGRTPVEDELDGFDVRATLRDDGPDTALLDLTLATMTVRASVRGLAGAARRTGPAGSPAPRGAAVTAEVLPRPRRLTVDRVRLQGSSPAVAVAELVLDEPPGADHPAGLPAGPRHDLGASGHRAVTLVDHLVTGLQLGQVLLYELDGLDRARSSTLWMRSTTVLRARPPRAAEPRSAVQAELRGSRVLVKGGVTWRCADIVSAGGGVTVVCSVAHALPGVRS